MIRAQTPSHVPNCLRYDGDRDQLEPVDKPLTYRPTQAWRDRSKGEQEHDRRKCETTPGSEPA